MSYSVRDIKDIIKVLEQVSTFAGNNVDFSEVIHADALYFLLNKALPTAGSEITYNNIISGLTAETVQEAIDELVTIIDTLGAVDITVIPSGSLTDTDVQSALETIFTRTDALDTRITSIENTYVKVTYFKISSSASGSVSVPTGGEIIFDHFNGEIDALVSKIDGSNTPTWEVARDSAGDIITVGSIDIAGNYVLDRTPTENIAVIYAYKIKRVDFNSGFSIGFETLDLTGEEIKVLYETNPDTNVLTDSEKVLIGLITSSGFGNLFLSDDGTYKTLSLQKTYEHVSKNIDSSNSLPTYVGNDISYIVYDIGGGMSITKTFNYTGNKITSVVLSGDTPAGISLTKTIVYSGNKIVSTTYT